MDTFKAVVVLSVVVCIASLIVIGVVTEEAIRTASIPDSQSGVVFSKAVSDKSSAMYAVTLVGGKVLYIQNNTLLYDCIVENQSFRFDCRIDYNNNRIFIESVNPQMGLVTAKAPITDGTVHYGVTLSSGRTLYIASNATLYDSINVNHRYLFDCSVDYGNNRFLIGSVKPLN